MTLLVGVIGLAAMLSSLAAESLPAFDVVSVRPNPAQFFIFRGLKTDPGRLVAGGASLSALIQQAYGVPDLRVSGVPADLGLFDIEGKTEGPHTRSELLEMLQTLLADRFKLKLHRELKELPVDAPMVGKTTPKLQAPAVSESDPRMSFRPGRQTQTVSLVSISGQNVTLPFVANYLSDRLRRIVVDKTGLSGAFDFSVELALDVSQVRDTSIPERDIVAQIYLDAVQMIGLKLERQKASVEILVVDHAERPDEN
jgi:uncharacterized protein (TIGR03435 family)